MAPHWMALPPALLGALLVTVGIVRLWGDSAGPAAAGALLGAGLTLLGGAAWAATHTRDKE